MSAAEFACPSCGTELSVEQLFAHTLDHRAFMHLAAISIPLGGRVLSYIGLFAPARNRLSMARKVRLIEQLLPDLQRQAITANGRDWDVPLAAWAIAIDGMLAQRDKLRLPLTGEGIIEIAFRGNPQRRVNALTALSEGHIRCLGLAILLAKAESVRAPLIIFDDAINAIDHDHRSGIRAAIFESDRFRETQVVVTCHSPEFVKDVENHLPRELRGDCQQYVLLHHRGDHQPRVNPDVGSQNYLTRAREALDDRFDPRDALSHARKSLEMLTDKAWKWLESHRVGNISVQIEGPGKEPQLRTLCDALRIKLQGAAFFAHASKPPLLDNLNTILGIPEQNLVWTLLNKGTHEEPDRDDFDLQHVETVLRVLGEIDRLEMRRNR